MILVFPSAGWHLAGARAHELDGAVAAARPPVQRSSGGRGDPRNWLGLLWSFYFGPSDFEAARLRGTAVGVRQPVLFGIAHCAASTAGFAALLGGYQACFCGCAQSRASAGPGRAACPLISGGLIGACVGFVTSKGQPLTIAAHAATGGAVCLAVSLMDDDDKKR